MREATVMNWHRSHHCVPRSVSSFLSPAPRIHPSCRWKLISSRIAVIWGEFHSETEKRVFLPKRAVTEFLWLTVNRFSLDDSWAWTGGASLPEAQRPRAGCHARAKSLSLGRVAFLLGGSTLDKPDSHDLFMLYLPSSNQLVTVWASTKRDGHLFTNTLIYKNRDNKSEFQLG